MEKKAEPETEMRSQFFTEGKPVDLNCGRYCTEAAVKWWLKKKGVGAKDVFHELLSEPSTKFGMKIAWAPWEEGKDITFNLGKPTSVGGWKVALKTYGPLIVSGDLGSVLGLFYVGHFILVVGAEDGKLFCQDPLQEGKGVIPYDFDWIQGRIETVSAVNPDKVIAKLNERETQRLHEATGKLSPLMTKKQQDDIWNDLL